MIYDNFVMEEGIDGFHGATEAMGGYGNMDDSIVVILVSLYLLLLGALLIGAIADYLLRGFGMYKLGKAEGKNNCWLAFIPFARAYFQGELSGEIRFKKKSLKTPGLWLVLIPIIGGVLAVIGYVMFMIVMVSGAISANSIYNPAGMISGFLVFFVIALVVMILYQAVIHVLYVLVNHQIYERYTSKNMAIIHAILGVLLPLYEPICLFVFGRRAEQACEEQQISQSDFQQNYVEMPVSEEQTHTEETNE